MQGRVSSIAGETAKVLGNFSSAFVRPCYGDCTFRIFCFIVPFGQPIMAKSLLMEYFVEHAEHTVVTVPDVAPSSYH